jgi:hypothetical protein
MTADDSNGRLNDDDYPAYTMGRAAEILGTTQGFLRAIGEHRLITPLRSAGGASAENLIRPGRRRRGAVQGIVGVVVGGGAVARVPRTAGT